MSTMALPMPTTSCSCILFSPVSPARRAPRAHERALAHWHLNLRALAPRSAIQVLLADLCKIQQQGLRQGVLQARVEPRRFGGVGDARQGSVELRQCPGASLPLKPITLLEVRWRAQ